MSITQASRKRSPGISSLFTLVRARWRQHWLLLLVITLGMIASITLVSTIPLLSEVLQTAGLRSAFTSVPQNAELGAHITTPGLSNATIDGIRPLIDTSFQNNLHTFLDGPPRMEIQTPDFGFISPARLPPAQMTMYATSMDRSASHLTLLQGRLPSDSANTVEIAITPESAKFLGVKLNDFIILQLAFLALSPVTHQLIPTEQPLKLHIVGIFHVRANDTYWHDIDYLPVPPSDQFPFTTLSALTSDTILLHTFDAIAQKYQQSQVTFGYPSFVHWYYHLDPQSISINQLDDLIARLNAVQVGISENFASSGLSFFLTGTAFHTRTQQSLLEQLRTRLGTVRIPIGLLTGLIVFLLLFFISVMIVLLVDRQAETIVVLRSRGASNFQIFVSLLTQCIGLSIIALIAGLLLTPLVLPLVVRLFLGSMDQGALAVVMNAPAQALWSVRYYALITALIAIIVMGLSLLSITRLNLMAASNARGRLPLWRRLNLDLFAALIALVGYGISIYLGSIQQQLDTQIQALVVTPLAFIGPFFLLLAALLLLLRIIPRLLRLGARLAARGRHATPLLALAQISRAPRKSLRMMLLLALTIAFAFFTLVFAASQAQRASDIASYEVGADFSGTIPAESATHPVQEETALYRHIAGVTSVSVGYEEQARSVVVSPYIPLLVRAVDATTYASTAYWTSQDSPQSLSSLMSQLLSRRATAIKQNSVPTIITTATANNLSLRVGSRFPVFSNGIFQGNAVVSSTQMVVMAIVNHIPAIDESVESGILVDYQTFATAQENTSQTSVALNHVWLRTSDDTATTTSINTRLTSSSLHLDNLTNRYTLANELLNDPLYFNVIAVLALGVTAAFLLALFGNLLASWLSARSRLTSFVVLRALGASMRGIASLFLWEQGIIYATALLLGLLSGALLAFTVVPALIFTGVPPGALDQNGFDFLTLQHIIPASVTLPFSLLAALLVFVATCAVALSMMVSLVLRRSMGHELRLQDDARLDFITREETATPRSRAKPAKVRRARPSVGLTTWQLTLLQLRRSPLLISLAGLTMIAAIGVMCVVPLYSAITTDGGLHNLLRSNPATSQILLNTSTQALSTRAVQGVKQRIDSLAQKDMGQYFTGSTYFTIQEPDFQPVKPVPIAHVSSVNVVSAPMQQAASHLTLLQGRMAASNSEVIETLLTPDTARTLGVTIGSRLVLSLNIYAVNADPNGSPINQTITLNMLVVGLIKVTPGDIVWHGNDFQPLTLGKQEYSDTLLVSNEAFLAKLDQAAGALHTDAVFTSQPFELTWNYHLNIASLPVDQLNATMSSLGRLQADIDHLSGALQNNQPVSGISSFPYLLQVGISDSVASTFDLPGILTRYLSRVDVIAIPIFILSALIVGLMLYFVSLLAHLLVDRQADAIAVLRSRGASSRQIFNAMVMQSILLGLIALVIGPLLALVAAGFLASRSLTANGEDALTFFTGHLWNALLSIGWYALATAAGAILALIIALRYAAGMNIHALRQESARSAHRPIWQRLRLDVIAIVIAFAGYFISLYVNSTENVAATRSIVLFSSPLTLITPVFLVIGCILLLLRLYPLLLRLGAWLSSRGKGATTMLAFAHMSRSPRQTLRVTLLLALTVAFAIFSLVFTASQTQRSTDIAAFESGADFSGDIAASAAPAAQQQTSLHKVTSPYQQLPGVISASGGYSGDGVVTVVLQDVHLVVRAVDANTFGQTANWTAQDSSQSLASLMSILVTQRANAIQQGRIPIIIDAATASSLNVHVGTMFSITMNNLPDYSTGSNVSALNAIVVAEVQHIPTVNEGVTLDAGGDSIQIGGGILLDYTTYASLYQFNNSVNPYGVSFTPNMLYMSQNQLNALFTTARAVLPINHLWLHTQDDPSQLARVRAALATAPLRLNNLYDRRALLDTLNVEPLYLALLTLLTIGATITLVLVLIGYVLASWQNAQMRSGTFTTLRSLGATSLQVAGQFLLEQGFVFVVALLIGFLLGGILSATVVPTLVFSDIPITGILSNLSDSQFYAIQHTFPKQIVIPSTLGMALALFAGICIIAIGTMVWTVLRPSLGQAIRLNED